MSDILCDAKIRPLTDISIEISCHLEEGHGSNHTGVLSNYAYNGSQTVISWVENDRRNFYGVWPGLCSDDVNGCVLPRGHRGECAT